MNEVSEFKTWMWSFSCLDEKFNKVGKNKNLEAKSSIDNNKKNSIESTTSGLDWIEERMFENNVEELLVSDSSKKKEGKYW